MAGTGTAHLRDTDDVLGPALKELDKVVGLRAGARRHGSQRGQGRGGGYGGGDPVPHSLSITSRAARSPARTAPSM